MNDVNLRISEWFEKMPPVSTDLISRDDALEFGRIESDGGAWWFCGSCDGAPQWIAVNYYTSEEANAKLLEAMPFVRVEHDTTGWLVVVIRPNDPWFVERHPDRKTAVVMAFCKFAGISTLHGSCHAGKDGDCNWSECPQLKNRQPHCPLDTYTDEERGL